MYVQKLQLVQISDKIKSDNHDYSTINRNVVEQQLETHIDNNVAVHT